MSLDVEDLTEKFVDKNEMKWMRKRSFCWEFDNEFVRSLGDFEEIPMILDFKN